MKHVTTCKVYCTGTWFIPYGLGFEKGFPLLRRRTAREKRRFALPCFPRSRRPRTCPPRRVYVFLFTRMNNLAVAESRACARIRRGVWRRSGVHRESRVRSRLHLPERHEGGWRAQVGRPARRREGRCAGLLVRQARGAGGNGAAVMYCISLHLFMTTKRSRSNTHPGWAEQLPVLIRAWSVCCTFEDYTNSAVVCRSWRAALEEGLDTRRPWFVTSLHRAKLHGFPVKRAALVFRHEHFLSAERLGIRPSRFAATSHDNAPPPSIGRF